MNRTTTTITLLAFTAAAATGCTIEGRAQGTMYAPPPPTLQAQVAVAQPPPINIQAQVAVPANVVVVQAQCQPGAPEQCNGIDDNCNGAIDEGCGYQSGNIQVTVAWNSSSDVDLHVYDPSGQEVYYGNRQIPSGGHLDHDANAACSVAPPTVENVYWDNPNPPRGTYRAEVRAYDMCNMGQTPVTLSISVGGRIQGTYQYTLTHRGDLFQIPFTIQ
jgi:hypothetical protein